MKRIKVFFLLVLLIVPIFLNAKTYDEEVSKANELMDKDVYNRSYDKYIVHTKNIKYEFSNNENKVNSSFIKGGFISMDEFNLTKKKNVSYLFDGVEFWTLSQSGDKVYAITYDDIDTPKSKSSDFRGKVTEFVNPIVTVHGEGRSSNPWSFDPIFKVSTKVDSRYATMISENEAYVKGGCTSSECTANIKMEAKTGFMYITNDCNGLYDETNKVFTVNNIKRDTVCNVTFGKGIFKITLVDATPNTIYLKHGENYYKSSNLKEIIKKIDSVKSKTGYSYNGYYYNDKKIINGNVEPVVEDNKKILFESVINKYIMQDVTLEPAYIPNQYAVQFDCNGGNNPPAPQLAIYGDSFTLTSQTCQRPGYKQNGWNTQADGSGESWTLTNKTDITWTIPNIVKLFAVWEPNIYEISLDNQGATTEGTVNIFEKYGVGYYKSETSNVKMTTTANPITRPTKIGHKFKGYYTLPDGGGDKYINENGYITSQADSSHFDSNGTLYAYWTANLIKVQYNGNDGHLIDPHGSMYTEEKLNNRLTGFILRDRNGVKSRDVQIFEYGSIGPETGLNNYNSESYINIGKSGFKAVSGAEWKCKSDSNCINENNTFNQNEKYIEANRLCDASEGDCTVKLYVNWESNIYTITLDKQGASSSGLTAIYEKYDTGFYKDIDATSQITVSSNAIGSLSKTGYYYFGYYSEPNGGGTQIITSSGYLAGKSLKTFFTSDSTIYAFFKPKIFKINLNNQGATTTGTTEVYEKYNDGYYKDIDATTQITSSSNHITKPTKKGYKFAGYYTSTGEDGIKYIDENGYITSEADPKHFLTESSLYAHWTPNKIRVQYNGNGGHLVDPHGSMYTEETNANGQLTGFMIRDRDGVKSKDVQILDYDSPGPRTGLNDYDNDKYLHIGRIGYKAVDGSEWYCPSGCKSNYYHHHGAVPANSICDASNGDCTVVMYVNWERNRYNIAYNLDGGVHGNRHPTSTLFNDPVDIDNPTKDGYVFEGWTFNGDTSTALHTDSSTHWTSHTELTTATRFYNLASEDGATVTLTAHWKRKWYPARVESRGRYYAWKADSNCGNATGDNDQTCGVYNCNTYGVIKDVAYVTEIRGKWVYGYVSIKSGFAYTFGPLFYCFGGVDSSGNTKTCDKTDGYNHSCESTYNEEVDKSIKYNGETYIYAKWWDDTCCWNYTLGNSIGSCSCSTENQWCKSNNNGYTQACFN